LDDGSAGRGAHEGRRMTAEDDISDSARAPRLDGNDSAPAPRLDCDVLIVGGGLVGSALAAALAALPIRTVLVEAEDPNKLEQPSFDGRVTALANGSARILSALGLERTLETEAEPILSIHISERGRFGAARIRAAEEGVAALGYTLENRGLGRALWERLRTAPECTVLAPARLTGFRAGEAMVEAEIESAEGRKSVRAKLLVAADGARSRVRGLLRIEAREDHYAQKAVILNCTTAVPHRGGAFERFTANGVLAMLPLQGGRAGVIWSLPAACADEVAALPDEKFSAALQREFGYRLGRIVRTGKRALHELRRVRSDALGAPRVVLIGNAAVSLHPVAGQGFNLALRDVAALAEIVADEFRRPQCDVGAAHILQSYEAWRAADQRKVAWFTHELVGLFGRAAPGLGVVRGLGLIAFDLLPGAKAALARHTMGLAGRLPRLSRGVNLA
ncbi:MAG TPA: 2-octaprenyl-6-methoxyphenyl hydroxylase, partial [Gammaproteobacteria bacterium]|nr:2-octaprenyl-6-methoxyphenyl hydroxylase [Gammaproteobacteria bacterium]